MTKSKSYFEKFKDVEVEEDKSISIVVPKSTNAEFADFLRYFLKFDFSDNPREDVFKLDSCTISKLGGENAQIGLLAAKLYLSPNESQELFDRYNQGLNDYGRHDGKYDHLIRWTYNGRSFFYSPESTSLDYFVNLAFENFDEADLVLKGIEARHESESVYMRPYSLLALASAGKKDLVQKSLRCLEKSKSYVDGLFLAAGQNMGGYTYNMDYFPIKYNTILGLVYHMIGEHEKRDFIANEMSKFNCFIGDGFHHYDESFEEKNPSKRLPCWDKGGIEIETTSLFLELLKHSNTAQYEKTKTALHNKFKSLDKEDHKTNLGFKRGLTYYFIYLASAHKDPIFQMR